MQDFHQPLLGPICPLLRLGERSLEEGALFSNGLRRGLGLGQLGGGANPLGLEFFDPGQQLITLFRGAIPLVLKHAEMRDQLALPQVTEIAPQRVGCGLGLFCHGTPDPRGEIADLLEDGIGEIDLVARAALLLVLAPSPQERDEGGHGPTADQHGGICHGLALGEQFARGARDSFGSDDGRTGHGNTCSIVVYHT